MNKKYKVFLAVIVTAFLVPFVLKLGSVASLVFGAAVGVLAATKLRVS